MKKTYSRPNLIEINYVKNVCHQSNHDQALRSTFSPPLSTLEGHYFGESFAKSNKKFQGIKM